MVKTMCHIFSSSLAIDDTLSYNAIRGIIFVVGSVTEEVVVRWFWGGSQLLGTTENLWTVQLKVSIY